MKNIILSSVVALALVAPIRGYTKIKVAVIDTGIDINSERLKPYISRHSRNFSNTKSGDFMDQHGHGTHISSLIVEYSQMTSDELEILVLKYYDSKASAELNLKYSTQAILYAIAQGVDIINYSAGGMTPDKMEEKALKIASQKDILIIAAAGNEQSNSDILPFYPASYDLPNLLSVGAHDQNYHLVTSSNYGKKNVHISALGKDVLGSLPNNLKTALTGTSQATAITSGVAAKLKLKRKDLKTATDLKRQLLETSVFQKNLLNKNRNSASISATRALHMRDSGAPALLDEKLAYLPE